MLVKRSTILLLPLYVVAFVMYNEYKGYNTLEEYNIHDKQTKEERRGSLDKKSFRKH